MLPIELRISIYLYEISVIEKFELKDPELR